MKQSCEMVEKNLCLGCVGLAEEDWQGKYKCNYYKELKRRTEDDKIYFRFNNWSSNRNVTFNTNNSI